MTLDHEKLDTYHRTLDLLDLVGQIYDAMPPAAPTSRTNSTVRQRRSC